MMIFSVLGASFGSISLRSSAANDILRRSMQSYQAAESGTEDAAFRLITGKQISAQEVLIFDGNIATTTIMAVGDTQEITALGEQNAAIRALSTILLQSAGTVFHYGVQTGEGGLALFSNAEVNGNVFSNGNITGTSNSEINGDAIAAGTISSPEPDISGTKTEDADPLSLPPIDLAFWRAQANINNDPITEDYEKSSGSDSFGPKKIEGDFALNSNAQFTVTGPLHITGNFEMNSNADLFLDPSFGSEGTVIVVDGTISFNSNTEVHHTGASPRGYILLVTPSTENPAIELNSNSELEAAIYAPNGTIVLDSNGDVISASAYQMELNSNAAINYDTGIVNMEFQSGPSGGYEITTWKEIE